MVNKRGESELEVEVTWWVKFLIVFGVFIGIMAVWTLISGNPFWPPTEWGAGLADVGSFSEATAPQNLKSFSEIFGRSFVWLDYLVGRVPQFLIDNTIGGENSAAIIMAGIWLMFFFIFSDIAVMFSSFRPYVGWIIGFVLTVMAANLKVTTFLAVFVTAFTAGFGVISVGASLVLMFILFLMFNFGSQAVRNMIVSRKQDELKMRAAIGRRHILEGAKTAKELGKESEKG